MVGEIKAMIQGKLDEKTEAEIDKGLESVLVKNWEDLPSDIVKVGFTVSYDMEWNKRSTGKVYDSLSSCGFLIGCRIGNLISMGIKKRNASHIRYKTKKHTSSPT